MDVKSKSNRSFRGLKVETLEHRELMAADTVNATLSGGMLHITGTNNQEHIVVNQVRGNITVSLGSSSPFRAFPASAVSSLRINLNDGNDRLNVNLQNKSLDAVFVDLGNGSSESIDLKLGSVRLVNVNAVNSLRTAAILSGSISESARIDFGNDPTDDRLSVNKSYIRSLEVNTGGGNDGIQLTGTRVERAMIHMGSGDDMFTNLQSDVSSGSIDGGSAVRGNTWRGTRFRGPAIRGF